MKGDGGESSRINQLLISGKGNLTQGFSAARVNSASEIPGFFMICLPLVISLSSKNFFGITFY